MSVSVPPTDDWAAFAVASAPRAEVAVLDRDGVIVAVNDAWAQFARDNRCADLARCGPGTSYLAVCDAAGDDVSAAVAGMIRRAVAGLLAVPVRVTVPCDAPDRSRLFLLMISSRFGDDARCVGACLVLVPVVDLPLHAPAAPVVPAARPVDAPTLLGEPTPDGWFATDTGGRILAVNQRLEVLTGRRAAELVGRPVSSLLMAAGQAGWRPDDGGLGRLRRGDGSPLSVHVQWNGLTTGGRSLATASVRDLSAALSAEELVRQRAAVLDLIPDAVVSTDPETGQLLYVNDSACRLLGYSREELLAMRGTQLRPEWSVPDRRALITELASRPGHVHRLQDVTLRRRDGSLIDCQSHLTMIELGSGRNVVLNVVRDVREQLALIDRLRRSEASFRTVFDQAPVGALVAVVGDDGGRRIVRANAALARTLGVRVDDLIGEDLSRFAAPLVAEDAATSLPDVARGGSRQWSGLRQFRARDGSLRWLDFRVVPVQLPDLQGPLVLAYLVDVTERQEALEQLAASDASFRTVFERFPVAAVVVSLDPARPRLVRANRAAARLFGRTVEALLAGDGSDVMFPAEELLACAGATPGTDGGVQGSSTVRRFRRPDGSQVWAEVHAVGIRLPDLPGPLALVHLVDVTERRLREARRARAAAIDQLIARVVTAVLADQPLPDTYRRVVAGVGASFGAADVVIVLPDAGSGDIGVIGAHGPLSTALLQAEPPVRQEFISRLAGRSDHGMIVPPVVPGLPPELAARLGPIMATRFGRPPEGEGGVLVVARERGEDPFSAEEVDLLTSMATQLTLAIRLGWTRSQQRRDVAERDAYWLRLEDGLRPLSDARAIQATACRLLGERLEASRVLYVDIEADEVAVVRHEYRNGVGSVAERMTIPPGIVREVERSGASVVVDDVATDPRFAPAGGPRPVGPPAAAGILSPLVKDGRLIAALSVHSARPRHWTDLEVQLARDTAERTWAAVQWALAEQASDEERRRRRAVERELVEQAARDQRERLEQEFITNAAHELRTPLTGILAAVDALEAGAVDDAVQRRRFLTHLRRESVRMARLSDSLLLLAQAQSLGPPPAEPLGVAELLRSVAGDLHPAEGVAVVVDADPALVLHANPGLVEVLVGNIAANAAGYTVAGQVRLSARDDGAATVIEVCDTGPGMDEPTLLRARDRFFRSASSRDRGGFGLGLSIAARAAAAMGARLELLSTPAEGTCARVTFPADPGGPGGPDAGTGPT